MALNKTTFSAALKQLYPVMGVEQLAYTDNVLFGLMPKNKDFGGEVAKIPVNYARVQNRSADFTAAKGNNSTSKKVAWLIDTIENYSFAFISNKVIEESKGNTKAFVSALKDETDMAVQSLARDINVSLFGDGSGQRGQVSSGYVSGNVITLEVIQNIVAFEVGMQLQFSPNADGSSPRAGVTAITAVDRDLGTITITATDITGLAASDFIFANGDIGSKLSGLAAWLPATAPTSTPFFGVDRTVDATRLGGVRFDASSSTHRQGLFDAANRLGREGGKPDIVVMNHDDFAKLQSELEADATYDKSRVNAQSTYQIAYEAISVVGPTGKISVVVDRDCPVGTAYMLTTSTWKLMSTGEPVRIFDLDGSPVLREQNSDSVEVRIFSYAQLVCKAPGHNANITLPAL